MAMHGCSPTVESWAEKIVEAQSVPVEVLLPVLEECQQALQGTDADAKDCAANALNMLVRCEHVQRNVEVATVWPAVVAAAASCWQEDWAMQVSIAEIFRAMAQALSTGNTTTYCDPLLALQEHWIAALDSKIDEVRAAAASVLGALACHSHGEYGVEFASNVPQMVVGLAATALSSGSHAAQQPQVGTLPPKHCAQLLPAHTQAWVQRMQAPCHMQ